MSAATLKKGDRVRFTSNTLGTVRTLNSSRFTDVVVNAGDEGTYFGPHPHPHPKLKGWQIIEVHVDGETLFVPCDDSNFEVVR